MKDNKLGRNSLCPCGSGKKYKKCCLNKPFKKFSKPLSLKERYFKDYKIRLKNSKDIEMIKKAGKLVIETLNLIESELQAGMTTNDIDIIVRNHFKKKGAKAATLDYMGYPKNSCVSVNNVICHGIPDSTVIKNGDIVNVDITPIYNGYLADANKTFFVGDPGPEAKKIVSVSKQCLKLGMEVVKPGNTIGDIGWVIQNYAQRQGCSVVEDYVGHGVGFEFHEAPQVPHFGKKGAGIKLIPGMVFTIEPMINLGRKDVVVLKDEWTAVTKDNSLSAQFEQTIYVTKNGYESLTPFNI